MQFEDSQIACAWIRACFEKEFHHQILSLNDPKSGSIALDVDGVTIHADFKDQELQCI